MNVMSRVVLSAWIGTMLTVPAFGVVTVSLTGPTEVYNGQTVTYKIYVSASPSVGVRGSEMWMPCSATGGIAGSVDYNVPPVINTSDPDYIFRSDSSIEITNNGSCPGTNPKLIALLDFVGSTTVGVTPQYLGEFVYTASVDAQGTFTIDIVDPPTTSFLLDEFSVNIPATWQGLTIDVAECFTALDCDDGIDCTDDMCNAGVCSNPLLPAGSSCGDPSSSQCDNPDTCDGVGICLPNNLGDGTPCDDGNVCTNPDTCTTGVCGGPAIDCWKYVDVSATGASNGTSWADAYTSLQDALADPGITGGPFTSIWVAAGAYFPDDGGGITPGDRTATFQLLNGVAIYGGFAGGETLLAQRDPVVNVTSLSGDIGGDDTLIACTTDSPDCDAHGGLCADDGFCIIFSNNGENSYHVTTGSGTDATAILDGIIITAGNANDVAPPHNQGGGMYNNGGNPAITNCTFRRNNTDLWGGGVWNDTSNSALTSCLFEYNMADEGGGINNARSTVSIIDCNFHQNAARNGGGIANGDGSVPTVTRCDFDNNVASGSGGGLFSNTSSSPQLVGCRFFGNAAFTGGGMYSDAGPAVSIINCTYFGNTAVGDGGAMYMQNSNPMVVNTSFHGNSAQLGDGGGMANFSSATPTITNCTFVDNSTGADGGGLSTTNNSDAIVTNCIFWANSDSGGIDESAQFNDDGTGTPLVNYNLIQGLTGGLGGTGNIGGDPLFIDADGADNIAGTQDDNLRIQVGSPVIDAGDNDALPTDTGDVDNNGNTSEIIPHDLDGNTRRIDDLSVVDTGNAGALGTPNVDIGAYEFNPPIFVNDDASGANDGSSWTDAYTSLQDALAVAGNASRDIWVAAGTYLPDRDAANPTGTCVPGPCDRTATFQLLNGVAIYGGFAGSETMLSQRDPEVNVTILSGDLSGDDSPVACTIHAQCASNGELCADDGFCIISNNNGENSYHVTMGSATDSTAVIDGFTITGGNANNISSPNNAGGGMRNDIGMPTVTRCTFLGNAGFTGGGIFNGSSSPTIEQCTLSENWAFDSDGGAISNTTSNPMIVSCLFRDNSAMASGGAIFNRVDSNPTITNCEFVDNYANANGGAIQNVDNCNPTVTSSTFRSNSAGGNGGGVANFTLSDPVLTNCTFNKNTALLGGGMSNDNCSPTLTNCTFSENDAFLDGGGLYNGSGLNNPILTNCILWGNSDSGGMDESAQIHTVSGLPVVNYSIVMGTWTGAGGTGNSASDPLFVDADGADNIAGTQDDDLRIRDGSPAIDAGDNTAVPADTLDLDNDGDTTEPIPFDLDGTPRFVDISSIADTGNGTPPIVDMGAYENVPPIHYNWNTPAGGGFSGDGNWDQSGVPGSLDNAYFNLGTTGYSVTFADNVTTAGLSVGNDVVTFDLGGNQYTITSFLDVLATDDLFTSQLTLTNGTMQANSLARVVVGKGAPNNTANLILDGGTTSIITNNLYVGGFTSTSTSGTFTLQNGADATVTGIEPIRIGRSDTQIGTVNVDGAGSNLDCTASGMTVGNFGDGTLNVTNGGVVNCSNIAIGINPSAVGDVLVTGAGSSITTSDRLDVGAVMGMASLTISSSGSINSVGGGSIGNDATAEVSIQGSWTSGAGFDVGNSITGQGILTIRELIGLFDQTQAGDGFRVGPVGQLVVFAGGTLRTGGSLTPGGTTTIGTAAGGTAMLTLNGGTWETYGPTDIGVSGPAIVTISDFGVMTDVGGFGTTIGQDGQIFSSGQMNGNYVSSGRIYPGTSPGVLTITGNYTQNSDGQLILEIDGSAPSSFDQINISGVATLDGLLVIDRAFAFTPLVSDTFTVMTYASSVGTFAQVDRSPIGNGLAFQLNYNATDLTLSVVADCNFNGIPDVEDLANCTGDPNCSDCNGNGIPDECDIDQCDRDNDPTCNDCNSNDIPDLCDITGVCNGGINDGLDCLNSTDCDGSPCIGAFSTDANGNGIPDECLVADGGGGSSNYTDGTNWVGGVAAINDAIDSYSATLDGCGAKLILDADVTVDTMNIRSCASLDVSGGDLTTALPGGIDVNGDTTGLRGVVNAELFIRGTHVVTTDGVQVRNSGKVFMDELSRLVVSDTLEIAAGGRVSKDPVAVVVASTIDAGTVVISGGSCAAQTNGGELVLDDKMTLNVTGDLIMEGSLETAADCLPSRGGVTPPPKFDPNGCGGGRRTGTPNVNIGGSLRMQDNVVVTTSANCARSTTVVSEAQVLVKGDVINHSTAPLTFDWSTGGIALSSLDTHFFEVAGRDVRAGSNGFALQGCSETLTPCGLGTPGCTNETCTPYTNGSIGLVDIGDNATVTFVDDFDNEHFIRGDPEALYVDTLNVGVGASVTVNNCSVYYRTLIPPEFAPTLVGVGKFEKLSVFIAAPATALTPHDMTKDRYLSFDPSTNVGQLTALRVTRVGSVTPWYVSCTLQDAGADGKLGELVQTPEFCDWTDSVIHVRGCEVVPGNEYVVEATADDVVFSSSLSIFTTTPQISASRQFGDVVGSLVAGAWTAPDGIVTVNDITSVVQKFQLNPAAPHLSRVDNDGKTPNGIVASNDILRAVVAFAGGDFGFGVTDCLTGTCVPSCP